MTNQAIAQRVVSAMWAWYESRPKYPTWPMTVVDSAGRVRRAPAPEELIRRHITVSRVRGAMQRQGSAA